MSKGYGGSKGGGGGGGSGGGRSVLRFNLDPVLVSEIVALAVAHPILLSKADKIMRYLLTQGQETEGLSDAEIDLLDNYTRTVAARHGLKPEEWSWLPNGNGQGYWEPVLPGDPYRLTAADSELYSIIDDLQLQGVSISYERLREYLAGKERVSPALGQLIRDSSRLQIGRRERLRPPDVPTLPKPIDDLYPQQPTPTPPDEKRPEHDPPLRDIELGPIPGNLRRKVKPTPPADRSFDDPDHFVNNQPPPSKKGKVETDLERVTRENREYHDMVNKYKIVRPPPKTREELKREEKEKKGYIEPRIPGPVKGAIGAGLPIAGIGIGAGVIHAGRHSHPPTLAPELPPTDPPDEPTDPTPPDNPTPNPPTIPPVPVPVPPADGHTDNHGNKQPKQPDIPPPPTPSIRFSGDSYFPGMGGSGIMNEYVGGHALGSSHTQRHKEHMLDQYTRNLFSYL